MTKKRVLHIAGGRGGAFLAADNLVKAINSYSQEFEAEVSPPAVDLMSRILRIEPDDRLTIDQILNHEWLQTIL
jgi:serine/threonine protein kinase